MNNYMKRMGTVAFAAALFACSCTDQKSTETEQAAIISMDSTAKIVNQATVKLDDQTQKVEVAIENLDKEFNENN